MSQPPNNHEPYGFGPNAADGGYGMTPPGQQPGGFQQAQEPVTPLPNDLSAGWLPEDTRQTPSSPLPEPKLFGYQSLLPSKFVSQLRHPGEIPWLVAAYITTLFVYIGVGIYQVNAIITTMMDPLSTVSDPGGIMSQILAFAVYIPIGIFWARAMLYAQMRLSGVRMSPTQFPEGYAMVVEAAHAAGLRRVPDAYVVLGNGTINAFASGHGHRRFIAIYSDLFEIGGKARNPEALRFIIGHEVGHIAAGHVGYFRNLFTSFFNIIPFMGSTLSRAQEYTADNFGYRLSSAGAMEAMSVLAAGKYLNRDVNTDELANRAVFEGGFFTWLANLDSSHPSLTWRTHALRDRSEPGRLIWKPKRNPIQPLSLAPAAEPAAKWADPIQASDFLATYPERAENQHWGNNVIVEKEPANQRDIKVGDTLFTGWVPPQIRAQYEAQAAAAARAAAMQATAATQTTPFEADYQNQKFSEQADTSNQGYGYVPDSPSHTEKSCKQDDVGNADCDASDSGSSDSGCDGGDSGSD